MVVVLMISTPGEVTTQTGELQLILVIVNHTVDLEVRFPAAKGHAQQLALLPVLCGPLKPNLAPGALTLHPKPPLAIFVGETSVTLAPELVVHN